MIVCESFFRGRNISAFTLNELHVTGREYLLLRSRNYSVLINRLDATGITMFDLEITAEEATRITRGEGPHEVLLPAAVRLVAVLWQPEGESP